MDYPFTVGVKELKARASEVLHELERTGTEVIITVHGRPVARLQPLPRADAEGPVDGMGASRGAWALPKAKWDDFAGVAALWEPSRPDAD